MEHLSLEIFDLTGDGSKYASLESDASITITETSEIFADGDVWSHSFKLNIPANAHIFGSADDIHGARLHDQIHKRKARLWAEGIPLYMGYLILGNEADVDENGDIDVSFESGQKTFKNMIDGAKANQVPLMNDVRFGLALWQKRWVPISLVVGVTATFSDGRTVYNKLKKDVYGSEVEFAYKEVDGEHSSTPTQEYPRMVFPKGVFYTRENGLEVPINDLNTDHPYTEDEDGTPTYPFCNVALCHQKYDYKKQRENGETYYDYSGEPEVQREYEYMPANRVNSAPNFYVLYWLRCLMTHLNIHIDENQMLEVEDLRRLFMVNTKCAFKERKTGEYIRTNNQYDGIYTFTIPGLACERRVAEYFGPVYDGGHFEEKWRGFADMVDIEKTKLNVTHKNVGEPQYVRGSYFPDIDGPLPTIEKLEVTNIEGVGWEIIAKDGYERKNEYLHEAFATSDCFPNVNISDVIGALEKGFGMRLLFDGDYQRVRIVLLRNIFRSDDVQNIDCDIIDEEKIENNIRGFRMTYGNTDDIAFYYKGFADKLPHQKQYFADDSDTHDYSHWDITAVYSDVIHKASAFNKTCYVTPATGNAYNVKIDKDAKRYKDLHPAMFETAGFMDAENGDCSGDEETIETVSLGFAPAIMNDLNQEAEKNYGSTEQRFALFVDEKMRVRRCDLGDLTPPKSYDDPDVYYPVDKLYSRNSEGEEIYPDMNAGDGIKQPGLFAIKSDIHTTIDSLYTDIYLFTKAAHSYRYYEFRYPISDVSIEGDVYAGYRLYLQDNFEPNDDGVSPIETHDWGLTFGIMRGSGSDATINYNLDYDDGEGNRTWDITPGSTVTAHPDTCDNYGKIWEYNGSTLISNRAAAKSQISYMFPSSNAELVNRAEGDPLLMVDIYSYMEDGQVKYFLLAGFGTRIAVPESYITTLQEMSAADRKAYDAGPHGLNLWIENDSSYGRLQTLLALQRMAFGTDWDGKPLILDKGLGSRDGRFSLKLREKKPNPFFNDKEPEGPSNKRYLTVDDANLRNRGLIDQFYKEYSYWKINGRIVKLSTQMTLAQISTLDKTKKVHIGNITGFVRKIQYGISNKTGLGLVTMEILYI